MDKESILNKLTSAGVDVNAELQGSADINTIKQNFKTLQGNRPKDTVDASRVGQDFGNIPTTTNTVKVDNANARIATSQAPENNQEPVNSQDFFSQLFQESGIEPEMANKFQAALNEASGGKFEQAGQNVLQNLLGAQVNQAERRKDTARLQEQAGLPELQSEFAALQGEADVALAARDSRIVNETGGQTTISKRTLANRTAAIQRQYGLQVADNRISQLAVAGQINAATQLIDASLDLKYGDIEAEIELYESQLQAIQPFMNAEQSRLAEQRQFVLQQAQNEINSARESEKMLKLQKVEAMKNAQDRGATPMQMAQIQDANSLEQVAATGFLTSANELLQREATRQSIRASQISSRADLIELAQSGDNFAIEELTGTSFNDFVSQYENEVGMSLAPAARGQLLEQYQSTYKLADQQTGFLDDKDIKNIDQSPQGKSLKALGDLKVKMNAYQDLIDEVGTESFGKDKQRLNNAYTELQLAYKEAANLGVLAGPDMELIERAVVDATPGFWKSVRNIGTLGIGSAVQTSNIKANISQAQQTLNEAAQTNLNQLYSRNPKYSNSLYIDSLVMPFGSDLLDAETINEMDNVLKQN